MSDIRKEERKLYAESQLLKSLGKNEKIKKDVGWEITRKRNEILKKQSFFHNYLMANEKIRMEESNK